ncbi:MAG: MetQ/NlpA family ABC transporter substrate-binding protein [Actinomycetes bacterium]|jgi:D-methionine transport system substrate-binding protein|nr:MetQ/NlpA family ABC transporter substrate-binding protein [Actinomycetes bacterium]
MMKVKTKKGNFSVPVVLALALALALAFGLVACSKSATDNAEPAATADDGAATTEPVTLVVGATPAPHAQILNNLKETLAAEGVTLEITEFDDYVLPNTALQEGELQANFFQHKPYLEQFNAEQGTDLTPVVAVHFEPLGIYPGKSDSLSDIKTGAKIAIDNDATNEARSLQLLQTQGLITLKEGVGLEATPKDIVDNPHKIKFTEADAQNLPRLLPDVDFAVINGNYALSSNIDITTVLATEDPTSEAAQTYANYLVVKTGNENDPAIQKLAAALTSDATRSFITSTFGTAVVPVF